MCKRFANVCLAAQTNCCLAEIAQPDLEKWGHVIRRDYHVSRIYTMDDSYSDIMILGQFVNVTSRDEKVVCDMSCRAVIDSSGSQPQISLFQLWMVS